MHLGSLESTQEARVALSYHLVQLLRIFCALQTSHVHPQLDIRTLSMNKFLIEAPIFGIYYWWHIQRETNPKFRITQRLGENGC